MPMTRPSKLPSPLGSTFPLPYHACRKVYHQSPLQPFHFSSIHHIPTRILITLLSNMHYPFLFSLFALWTSFAAAQFPAKLEGVTTIKSKNHPGVSISYKEPGICETSPGVKSYSGYVHLEPHTINETGESQFYHLNTFFWFFESRNDPANSPLVIYLNGGPGSPSSTLALSSHGPYYLNAKGDDTYLNSNSWNQ